MTRADLLAYLQSVFGALAAETGAPLTDTENGFKHPLDSAFRRLGVGESDLAAAQTASVEAAQALAEYFALRRFRSLLAARVDFDATAVQGPRSQPFNHVTALLEEAASRCAATGYGVGGDEGAARVRWNLDYIEPEVAEWGT